MGSEMCIRDSDGPFTNLNVTGVTTFAGDVSIGGTLTYEDVTNIDSVGLVTARDGIFIPDNKKLELGNAAGSGSFNDNTSQQGSPNKYLQSKNPRSTSGMIEDVKGERKVSGMTFPRRSTLNYQH